MKQFLRNLLIVIAGVLVVDFLAGSVCGHIIRSCPNVGTYDSRVKQTIFDWSADVIILGTSSANTHYVSPMIADSIGYSTHNAGVVGNTIMLSKHLLENFYTRCNPKLVIMELKKAQLSGVDKYIAQRRYYNLNPAIKEYIDENKTVYESLKLHSKMYCYNGSMLEVIGALFKQARTDTLSGYSPMYGWDETLVPQPYEGPDLEIQPEYYQCLKDMNDMCKAHHTIFLVVYSPCMMINEGGVINPLTKFCESQGIRFYNFDNMEIFANPKLFHDTHHMNDEGAHIFTQMFIERLKADSIVEQFYQGE